jgi:hypothetical protein
VRFSWLVRTVGVTALAAAAALIAAGKAEASAPVRSAVVTSYAVPGGQLWGVTAASPTAAWAVGWTENTKNGSDQKPLLLQWNGKKWSRVPVKGVSEGQLIAVSAASPRDVWAVGQGIFGSNAGIFILHWNGRAWSQMASGLNSTYQPTAVVATSHDVWVAAYNGNYTAFLHLTGGRWYVVPTTLTSVYQVTGLAVVSPTAAWATGVYEKPSEIGHLYSFLLRWNGSVWKRVADPLSNQATQAMASGAKGTVWMVGYGETIGGAGGQSARWDGRSWHSVPCPSSGGFSGVALIPGGTAWAVGSAVTSNGPALAHWTGSTWRLAVLSVNGSLNAVAASSVHDAWAVGNTSAANWTTLIVHWNGKTWS